MTNIGGKDIHDGDKKLSLGLMWRVI